MKKIINGKKYDTGTVKEWYERNCGADDYEKIFWGGHRMKKYELMPKDGHKSFYGKAIVYVDDNGTETLYSYNTKIISKDPNGKLKRFWDGYSFTTGRHIAAFCGLNKKEYEAMPIENS